MSSFNVESMVNRLGRFVSASAPHRVTGVVGGGMLLLIAVLFVACGDNNNNAASPQSTAASNSAPGNQAANNAPKSEDGSIQATPNPVPAGPGNGKSKITWKTKGNLGVVKVYVSENGQPENVFAQGSEGSVDAPWIGAGTVYEFRLYGEQGSNRKLIDKVQVTRDKP